MIVYRILRMAKDVGDLGHIYWWTNSHITKLALSSTVVMTIEDVAKAAKYDIRSDAEYPG